MLAVARPERRSFLHSAGSDQCVAQLNRMALAVTSQVFSGATAQGGSYGIGFGGLDGKAALAWLAVGIPLAWGVWITLKSAFVIFH